MAGFLEGIRVLDFSRAVAGSYTTVQLGDLGAEIIKIEEVPPEEPDAADPEHTEITDWITNHWAMNRNKKGICLNMKKESARAVFYELVKNSDIVFDNYRPHVLKNLGIEYETIKQYNPRIISCSVSGFGEDGPWKEMPAFDLIVQAMGGSMSVTGEPGRMPIRWGVPIGDLAAAVFAALGMVSAIVGRGQTGIGQRLDMSMLDVQLALHGYRVPRTFGMGMEFGPQPRRSGAAGQVPYGPYKTSDGRWIAIAGGGVQFWQPICKAVGREDLLSEPRFETSTKRREQEEEISRIFEEVFATKTADEWEQILLGVKIPAAKVNTIKEAFEHPQAKARNMLISFDHPLGQKMKFAANPIKVPSLADAICYKPAPGLGEHTKEILTDVLSYKKNRLATLKQEGAIWWPEKGLTYTRSYERYA
ncbi:CaiB/BaiF CoA transferase family protein [Chloroflexota bacterium]